MGIMWGLLALLFGAGALVKKQTVSSPAPASLLPKTVKTGNPVLLPMHPAEVDALAYAKFRVNAIRNEGKKLVVYLDSLGILTVGIGHKVLASDKLKLGDKITDAKAEQFFNQDAAKAFAAAKAQARELQKYTADFIAALAEVNFQLGTGWKSKFKNTWNYLKAGNYQKAISNLRVSSWAQQTPVRVTNFVAAIQTTFTKYT